jgi:hypothetical protein
MLPGFNHNIRYKDRVFHVQTEDTGLGQPFLVTQVFIGGHLVAIEKSSYADVLEAKLEQDKRNDQIRSRMQDQHKRLLKNLVKHAYDDKIALYLDAPQSDAAAPAIPAQALAEAESMPRADTVPPEPAVLDAATLPAAGEISDQELFKVFDEELQKQTGSLPPLDPEMFDPGDLVDTIPPEKAPATAPPRRPPNPINPDRTAPDRTLRPANGTAPRDRRPRPPPESPTEVGRKPPPIADTLVDFGLPAALKEQLGQAKAALEQARKKAQEVGPPTASRKSDPRVARFRMPRSPSPGPRRDQERETQIDLALRRKASNSRRPGSNPDSNADTLLDVDAGEIQEYIARKKRERSEKTVPAQPAKDGSWGDAIEKPRDPDGDSKRPSIVVVERSLDEVILSYLADED